MAKSNIEWTDFTWNPWHGMFRDKKRYGQDPTKVVRASDKTFYAPLKLKEPQRVFTCSWSDFFIEEADAWRDEAFAIMALTPHITYQILTKRPDRMLEWFTNPDRPPVGTLRKQYWRQWCVWAAMSNSADNRLACEAAYLWDWDEDACGIYGDWPLPNVWLGTSVEDQKTADERIPLLLETPAAVRFLSVEPLLGPVDLLAMPGPLPADAGDPDDECSDSPFEYGLHFARDYDFLGHTYELDEAAFNEFKDDDAAYSHFCKKCGMRPQCPWHRGMGEPYIDWVIVGGESGPNRRVAKLEWIESIVEQCKAASVPVFVKQIELGGKVEKDIDKFPAHLQIREFPNSLSERTTEEKENDDTN